MSREVSPLLSDYVVKLLHQELDRRKALGKYSQNLMAKDIGMKGGPLSAIMSGKKGIGYDLLPKFEAFLKKSRGDLEAEAAAVGTSFAVPAIVQDFDRLLHWLYKRYPKAVVDRVVEQFYPKRVSSASELDTLDVLDQQIRMASAYGRSAGDSPPATPKEQPKGLLDLPQRNSFEREAQKLVESVPTLRKKHTGK